MATVLDQQAPNPLGERSNADAMFVEVYARLKLLAHRQLSGHRHSLDTTALVNELYLRICDDRALQFASPGQCYLYAARAMRHLICDRARDRLRLKAGGAWNRTTLGDDDDRLSIASAEEAMALDDALEKLQQNDRRAAQVVELRYFAGFSTEQVAEVLGMSVRSVNRDWRYARAFLHKALL